MQAVIRVFSTFAVHSHLKCFSGQSSSQKSSQLILASHSPHLQPPPPLRSPFFLPCPSSGEVTSLGEVTGTLFFLLSVFHSALLMLLSPPRQPCLRRPLPVELLLCSHTTACRPQGGEPPSLSSAVLFPHHQRRDRINTTTAP